MVANNKTRLQVKIGPSQIAILAMTLFTAIVHLTLFLFQNGGIIMLLNSLGYLGFLVIYFFKFDFLPLKREWIRWAFMAYTALTFVAYFATWGMKSFESILGLITKLVELVLIFMLWREK